MAEFLLELRSEEIPARMQKGARAELEKLFRRELGAAGVSIGDMTVWSSPRRLALIARDLPTETAAVREEAKGPPVGAPDQAVDGFCRKNGVTREQLETRDVKGRATYFAVIEKPGQRVGDLLAVAIPAIIRDFSWPKSQRWGAASISTESLKWVRPLSGIIALLDGEVVPCEVDGIASGRETMGHRFHSDGIISVDGADDYADKLQAAHVIVDHEVRAGVIREGARKAAKAVGLSVIEDEGLVVENAGLTEWPVPLLGRFEENYLDVPPEVIQLTARVNQKYFVCEDTSPTGKAGLANAFICTANIAAQEPAVVVDGNRKVLAARLSDARFFWELDQKTTLAEHAKKLERITFHEKLGTVADKVERVAKLARWLCEEGIVKPHRHSRAGGNPVSGDGGSALDPRLRGDDEEVATLANHAEQAARLCKADLVTEMVGEFPELQGLMGGYYAEKEGLPREVSDAIRDHYKPVGQGDEVPTAPVTVAVSLADKLDTLVSFFAIDEKPTGSKDPFALRRAALSVLRLLIDNNLRSDLKLIFWEAYLGFEFHRDRNWFVYHVEDKEVGLSLHEATRKFLEALVNVELWRFEHSVDHPGFQVPYDDEQLEAYSEGRFRQFLDIRDDLLDFFADRLKVQQREAGVRHDLIDAVFALGGEDDLVRLLARVSALQAFVETENGTNLLAGYKRAANILKKENRLVTPTQAGVEDDKNNSASLDSRLRGNDEVDQPSSKPLSYTPDPAEKALIDALTEAEPKAVQAIDREDFESAMAALALLRDPIDTFFEDVTVNDPDQDKRAARLDLLQSFRDAVHRVADFSRIEG